MSDPDALLADLWAADEPPEHDAAFVIATMEQVERRRLWARLAGLAGLTFVIGLIAWALAPVLAPVGELVMPQDLVVYAAAALMALFLWSWASDRLQPLSV